MLLPRDWDQDPVRLATPVFQPARHADWKVGVTAEGRPRAPFRLRAAIGPVKGVGKIAAGASGQGCRLTCGTPVPLRAGSREQHPQPAGEVDWMDGRTGAAGGRGPFGFLLAGSLLRPGNDGGVRRHGSAPRSSNPFYGSRGAVVRARIQARSTLPDEGISWPTFWPRGARTKVRRSCHRWVSTCPSVKAMTPERL